MPAGPVPRNSLEQQFFGLIIGGVAEGDGVGSKAGQSLPEKPMPADTGSHLQRNPVPLMVGMHIFGCGMKGETEGCGEGLHEVLVRGRSRSSKLMIKVQYGHLTDAAEFPEGYQNMEEGHRIGPARNRDEDRIGSGKELFLLDVVRSTRRCKGWSCFMWFRDRRGGAALRWQDWIRVGCCQWFWPAAAAALPSLSSRSRAVFRRC